MMRINKYGLLLAVLLAPAAAMAQEARVVAVNTEEAVLKSEKGKDADTKLNAKIDEKKKEFDAKKKEIDDLAAEIERTRTVLKPEVIAEKQRTLDTKRKDFDRGLEDTDRMLDNMRRELLDPVIKVARSELDKMVAEKSYDIVLDLAVGAGAFPWVNPKIIITDELITRINTAMKTSAIDAPAKTAVDAKP